jgi:DHA1 family inner membrane transport protein
MFANTIAGLLIFLFMICAASSAVSPAIQTRLINVAGHSQTLAAAINHASLNIGNSFGAALGGAAIGASLGYLSVTWVGLALCALGVIIAVISFATERRSLHRAGSLGLQQNAVLDGPLP